MSHLTRTIQRTTVVLMHADKRFTRMAGARHSRDSAAHRGDSAAHRGEPTKWKPLLAAPSIRCGAFHPDALWHLRLLELHEENDAWPSFGFDIPLEPSGGAHR